MLSNAIVGFIDGVSGGFGLTKGTNLFAEQARGDQHIRVGVTTTNGNVYIPAVRQSGVNILVTGWSIDEGNALANRIANKLLEMEGGVFTYDNGSQVETYDVVGVTVRTWPVSFPSADKTVFTINFEFNYKQTEVTKPVGP